VGHYGWRVRPTKRPKAVVRLPRARNATSAALTKRLIAAGILLAVAAVAAQTAVHLANGLLFDGRYTQLNADSEYTPFSWASTVASFSAASVVLGAAIVFERRRSLLLAAVLAYLSLDDAIRLHERLAETALGHGLALPSYMIRLLWPALYVPILVLAVALLWTFARKIPTSARRLTGFGVLLLASAVVAEALSTILLRAGMTYGDLADVPRSRSRRVPSSGAGFSSPPASRRASSTRFSKRAPDPSRRDGDGDNPRRAGRAPRQEVDPILTDVRSANSVAPGLVVALFGPTASGKSAVAEELRSRIPLEVVSADSMQVYQGLPLLTAQPAAPTHLVGIWPLDHESSVAEYAELAHEAIDGAIAADRTPLIVGGTGLYLRAALAELDLPEAPEPGARARWERLYDERGAHGAHALLTAKDPRAARVVHPNDRRRIVRALELAEVGASLQPRGSRLWSEETRHPTLLLGLEVPVAVLERRIEERAREMIAAGVEEEVRNALAGPVSQTARQAIGLSELADLPSGEALAALVQRTRRFASYQRKWMRRIPGLVSVRSDRAPADVADEILEVARARQRLPARRAE